MTTFNEKSVSEQITCETDTSNIYYVYLASCVNGTLYVGYTKNIEKRIAAHNAVQMHTIIGLVAAGLGIAIVPASLQNFHRSGVIYRPLQEQIPKTGLYLAWRQHDSSPVIREFLLLARKTTQCPSNHDDT